MEGIAFRDEGRLSVTRRMWGEGKEVRTSGMDGGEEVRPLGREDMVRVESKSDTGRFGGGM